MKSLLIPVLLALSFGNLLQSSEEPLTTYHAPYYSRYGEEESDDIQCPIPKENRVRNYTGTQCVYSSIEMLGRWAEEPKLTNPPITSRSGCQSYSSASRAAQVLNQLKVKFEQTTGSREKGIVLIKKAMAEHRGCLIGVPGHAMVLIHYDEEKKIVKYVDNSDSSLKIQTMTMDRFNDRWTKWVLVIYADKDIIATKMGGIALKLEIKPADGSNRQFPKDFIPIPKKKAA